MNWHDRILSDPQVLRGKPCIKGTRIPAALILGYLAAGRETDAILKEFPDLTVGLGMVFDPHGLAWEDQTAVAIPGPLPQPRGISREACRGR